MWPERRDMASPEGIARREEDMVTTWEMRGSHGWAVRPL
jgi:hypothetical protein